MEIQVLGRVVPGKQNCVTGVSLRYKLTQEQRARTMRSSNMLHEIVVVSNDVAVGSFWG